MAVQYANETRHEQSATREMCEIVERQVRYASGIIDGLLELSQIRLGKSLLRRETTDLNDVVYAAVETNEPLLRNRRHNLALALPDDPFLVLADQVRIQQVINNLLTNAAKYTEPGGEISIAVCAHGDLAKIEIRDSGIGISAELIPRIFDLFQQGDAKCASGFPGLGIGLALVKSLVELHGGSISAYSDGAGAGTTFVVYLPGVITDGATQEIEEEAELSVF